jgi:hypothetical protein
MNSFISNLSPTLFWDTDITKIDSKTNAAYIVERVLTMGNLKEFKSLLEYYGKSELKKIIIKLRSLDVRTMHFCSIYFEIPLSNFRCYEQRQSNKAHWNY